MIEECGEEELAPPRRFTKQDIPVLFFGFFKSITGALYEWFSITTEVAASHANWSVDNKEFADEVRIGLESLPEAEE